MELKNNKETQKIESILNQKNYFDYWFKNNSFNLYEVQESNWNETIFSILNKMWAENLKSEQRLIFREIIIKAWENSIFPIIKAWDIINFWIIDNNSVEISINDNYFVINMQNKEIYKI